MRADLSARVTSRAGLCVDDVTLVRGDGDRVHWATLCAQGATGAIITNLVFDQGRALACRAAPLDVRFIFIAEVAKGSQNRVWRGFAQTAQASSANLFRQAL